MADENVIVSRDYTDIFSIKDMALSEIMPMFFAEETSNLTVGEVGMVTELIGTTTEDVYNTASVLLTEAFPNKAKMTSSIYSHAAIFQLSNIIANAASCSFLLVLSEEDIIKNFVHKDNFDYFYIDKDTTVYIEEIPFSLDYDIEIKSTVRNTKRLFSAKYKINGESKNSVSHINDPYIKTKRSSNGLIALQVELRQYKRYVQYESIIDNSKLNYPTIKVSFSDRLAGFDVFYKAPGDSDYNTKLETKVEYSLPSKNPFCYYKALDDSTIELSFTTKDGYFQPKFNSELKIVIYSTIGKSGNFEVYNGDNITITKATDNYYYNYSWALTAKSISASKGGQNPVDDDGLKALTVENFSTATCLSTESDLQTYFNNYKYRYDNEVLFIKKRDDAVERLFSAFMFIKNDDYFFPTNTLNLDTNMNNMTKISEGMYVLDPGYLFKYKDGSNKDMEFIYGDDESNEFGFLEDYDYYKIHADYNGDIYYYIVGSDGDFYEKYGQYYKRGGFRDTTKDKTYEDIITLSDNGTIVEKTLDYKDWINCSMQFTYDRERCKNYEKYLLYLYDNADDDGVLPDIYYNEWKAMNGIGNRLTIYNVENLTGKNIDEFSKDYDFIYTNPFMMNITKTPNNIGYYLTYINQSSLLDFVKQNDADSFIQFITYNLKINRDLSEQKKYNISIDFMPSTSNDIETGDFMKLILDYNDISQFTYNVDGEMVIAESRSLSSFNKDVLNKNYLRVIMSIVNDGIEIGYMELIPTNYNKLTDVVTFEGEFYTDDYITSTDKFRSIHVCPYCGHKIINSMNNSDIHKRYICNPDDGGCGRRFKEGFINVMQSDDLLFDLLDCDVKIYTLFKDVNNEMTPTDNLFVQYDNTYNEYIWTNVYESISDPITFIKPMNMLSSNIVYKDWFLNGVEPCDCMIYGIPVLKYSILAYKDTNMIVTDETLADDIGQFYYLMSAFMDNYDVLSQERTKLKNASNIDIKFYNTYGKSTNFTIGDNSDIIDTINISINFKVWIIVGTDKLNALNELRTFIKSTIESINSDGTNNLFISNLMRKVEDNFAYVDHIKFEGINHYSTDYQTVKNNAIKLSDLSKEERRYYVPDLLVINKAKINLTFYENN